MQKFAELDNGVDDFVKKLPFYSVLNKKEIALFAKNLVTHRYKKNQIILFQGGRNFGLFYILSGSVKITRSEKHQRESCLKFLKKDEFFGLENLYLDESFITVQSLEDSVVSFLPQEFFHPFVESNPSIALYLLKAANKHTCYYQEKLSYLTQNNAEENLAKVLLDLHNYLSVNPDITQKEDSGIAPYAMPLSRADLASMIGTAQETVIRILSKFKEDGYIKQEKRKIFVTNSEKIKSLTK
jgi:CRP-like cAMP-binding protein